MAESAAPPGEGGTGPGPACSALLVLSRVRTGLVSPWVYAGAEGAMVPVAERPAEARRLLGTPGLA